ncbi:kinase-like domain-containing protein, partial [Scleroderma citrinum]
MQKVLREAHVWSKLDHANVLPFIGITSDFEVSISLVSKWMASGDAHQYVQDETIDPRPLVVCIARGLHYLHNYPQGPIVHGDLKGANVLISDEGHALISDFGYTHLTNSSFDMTVSVPCGGTINWMAPEVLKPPEQKDPCLTVESDVWAFGMTILELFTRKAPFSYLKNIGTIVYQIVNAPPDRPRDDSTCYRMTYDWWAVCSDCWKSDPASRPSMLHLVNRIEGIKAIKDLTLGLNILSEKATSLGINLGFDQITRNIDVTTGSDGNAIVFQGVLQPGGKKLAVKNIRTGPLAANVHIVEEILRDVLLWSKVQHKNVIPVLGITTKFDHTLSIVSEWTEMKNAYDYVQNSEVDPRPLLLEIANGLEYLHTHQDHPLIHGDLRGINVFVSHEGHALIAFGITSLVNRLFEAPATRSRPLNWVAPEGLDNGGFTTTRQGDVWAFGMTALELFTRRPPFHDTESDIKAEVMRGPPERPSDEATHGRLTRMWWQGCLSCWNHEPLLRPTMTMIVKRIDQIMHTPEHSPPS